MTRQNFQKVVCGQISRKRRKSKKYTVINSTCLKVCHT
nr:MAG TPA: hypothetical protein [Caudoviricetes sp.]